MRRKIWPWLLGVGLASIAFQRLHFERTAHGSAQKLTEMRPAFGGPAIAVPSAADERRSLPELCTAAGVAYPPPNPRILVEKSARTLTLLSGDRPIFRVHVGLGFSPTGNKLREGDGRTPEGELRVVTRNDKSRFRRFLGLDYPRPSDALPGSVTAEERDAIERAHDEQRKPPWDTPLGGAVGIHGHGGAVDWTSGCVAVDDGAIDLLWEAAPMGTPVRVVP